MYDNSEREDRYELLHDNGGFVAVPFIHPDLSSTWKAFRIIGVGKWLYSIPHIVGMKI